MLQFSYRVKTVILFIATILMVTLYNGYNSNAYAQALELADTTIPAAHINDPYSYQLNSSGGLASTCAICSGDGPPSG